METANLSYWTLRELTDGAPWAIFLEGPASACHPARQQSRRDLLRRGGSCTVPRLARGGCDGIWLRHSRLCADDQPRALAGDAASRRQSAAHNAVTRPPPR